MIAVVRGPLRSFALREEEGRVQVDDLIRRSQVTTFLAGEPLITAGQVNHRMYLLLSGRLNVYLRTVDSEPIPDAKLLARQYLSKAGYAEGEVEGVPALLSAPSLGDPKRLPPQQLPPRMP